MTVERFFDLIVFGLFMAVLTSPVWLIGVE